MIDLDLFAGPGGWDVGAAALGIHPLGIELDTAACATRAAAGHQTIQDDVAAFNPEQLPPVRGLIGSPPCTTFSAAGDQAGNAIIEQLASLIRDQFAGHNSRLNHRATMAETLTASQWGAELEPAKRTAKIKAAVFSASLVAEPARYIYALQPEWVALEQVPAVLPLWQVYADRLSALGYSAWAGKLNAADYGVPQTRERAVLIASRSRPVWRPEPTHYDPRRGWQLWGTPWVTMAGALGWGASARPSVSVTSGGTSTGGAEPFGHRGRDAIETARDSGAWIIRTSYGQPDTGPKRSGSGSHGTHEMDPATRPAHVVTTKAKDWTAWPAERPAATVQGDPRIGRPGHKDRDKGEPQFAQDSIRITVAEAAVLQSFPPDYPWQGTKTKRFEQVGNAVPPLLAQHVLAMAAGVKRLESAA